MSGISLAFIIFGLLVVFFRAPLIWAPEEFRGFILSVMDKDQKMRGLGLTFGLLGALYVWFAWGVTGTPAMIVYYFGLFMILVGAVMAFATAKMRGFATNVWKKFSTTSLRLIGLISTVFGLALIYYGFTL